MVVASYVEVEGCEGVSGEVGDLGSVDSLPREACTFRREAAGIWLIRKLLV